MKRIVRLVLGLKLILIISILISCSQKKLKLRLDEHLKNNDSKKVYTILKYPKTFSKALYENRFKELVKNNLLTVDSVNNNNDWLFTIGITDKTKDLLLFETDTELVFIGECLNYLNIKKIKHSSSESIYNFVEAEYKRTCISNLFKLDSFVMNDHELNSKTTVFFKVKHTLFNFDIECTGQGNQILFKQ